MGYVQTLRLNHSYQLLATGQYTVGEVAAMVGYRSDPSFIRAFKLAFHCSPGKLK
jgi:AraC family transcriptional activator of pyochelin receptor